jgi:hypothetical protein
MNNSIPYWHGKFSMRAHILIFKKTGLASATKTRTIFGKIKFYYFISISKFIQENFLNVICAASYFCTIY